MRREKMSVSQEVKVLMIIRVSDDSDEPGIPVELTFSTQMDYWAFKRRYPELKTNVPTRGS